ncbi:rRNA maturation RNase YbeY [Schnuerera sp. xch1]|uniref:rRNA maturation RNase YbeY n=1 Tax=Schnuerera sp. xch1 TaxID=2874283 RepID=UPI001CBB3A44|nr:rRNA maturation RNase YbeY [Schnuerera sp. xch1]MBZ2175728.1 rRNA maturation RNase YbeY [Schnuerera sp. xch1]
MEVFIVNRQDKVELNESIFRSIKDAIRESLILEGRSLDYEISVSFVDNDEIRELNKNYRNIDSATDVLSFVMEEDDDNLIPIKMLGDIVISAEMALKQSIEYNHSLLREITYLSVHSMFHLLGYDHMQQDEAKIMRNKEKEVMKKLHILKKG